MQMLIYLAGVSFERGHKRGLFYSCAFLALDCIIQFLPNAISAINN